MKIVLTTERLLLRQLTEDDADHLLALDSDPEVMRFIGPFTLPDREAYRQQIRTRNLPHYEHFADRGCWAVQERSGGDFLGWIFLRPALDGRFAAAAQFQADDAELGYRFRKAAWRQGYATEVARALVQRAFDRPDTARVVASALVGNVASWRVMENVGMKRVGLFELAGYDEPSVKYALSRADTHQLTAQPG